VAGAAAVQTWSSGQGFYQRADGSLAEYVPRGSGTRGDILGIRGVGVRLRLGDRPIHVEYRQYGAHLGVYTLGTALHF